MGQSWTLQKKTMGESSVNVFKENGILGMMGPADYKNICQVSPFFGKIVDTMCDYSEAVL